MDAITADDLRPREETTEGEESMDDRQVIKNEVVGIPKWFLGGLGVVLVPGVVGLIFLTLQGNNHENRLNSNDSDRHGLKEALVKIEQAADKQSERINEKIEEQTKEIISLRLQIERLLVVRPSDVYRKTEEMERAIEDLRKAIEGRKGITPEVRNE